MARAAELQKLGQAAQKRLPAAPSDSGWDELLRVLDEELGRLRDAIRSASPDKEAMRDAASNKKRAR